MCSILEPIVEVFYDLSLKGDETLFLAPPFVAAVFVERLSERAR